MVRMVFKQERESYLGKKFKRKFLKNKKKGKKKVGIKRSVLANFNQSEFKAESPFNSDRNISKDKESALGSI